MKTRRYFLALASIGICMQALAGPVPRSIAPREKTIAVIGSSVAAGWVTAREAGQDMKNGWAFRLARHLEPLGYKVVNVSVPGDTTEKVLARLEKDLFPLQPEVAVISLSLENEGIRGIGGRDPRKVYEGFGTNLRRIIAECREHKIMPVVASCYANDNFGDPETYRFIVDMNLEIASWNAPSINFLGALDRGDARFIKGLTFDLDHPSDRGHRELFLSIVPGLFEALAAGRPSPERDSGPGYFSTGTPGRSGYLSCVPADPMHSFTSIFDIRTSGPGIAVAIRGEDGKFSHIDVTENGDAILHASTGAAQRVRSSLRDGKWHRVGWIYHYLKNEMTLYVDGTAGPSVPAASLPVQFLLGGSGGESPEGLPATAEFRDWMVYRVPLNSSEMEAIQAGRLLPSSLEVFAPLRGGKSEVDSEVENRAQSASRVVFMPRDVSREIARLETAIARQDRAEIVFIDPNEKKPVFVAPDILAAWKGVYEIAPGLVLTVVMEEDRLFLLVNGGDDGKTELFPSSAERFFIKAVGPQMEISFQAEKGDQPAALVFKVDAREMKGTRKETAGIRNVSCPQALKIIQEHQLDSDFVILDFRTKDMFVESHIEGAIHHDVFAADIDGWLKSLDKNKAYLIYCTVGQRSGIALEKMKQMGFVNVLHMFEGLTRWKKLGYKTASGNKLSQDPGRLTEPSEESYNAIQPPDLVMDLIGIRPGLVVGEVGAGRGRVTVHLAARVGDKGKIYANDIDQAAIDYLKDRCRRQGLSNVETILGGVDDARFPKNSLDLVFMAWVFHHVDQPVPLLKSLMPSLKPWGVVVMVEPAPAAHGEESARMLTRELVGREAEEAGFKLDAMIEGRLKEDNIFVLRPAVPDTPDSSDPGKVRALWLEFLAWGKTSKAGPSFRGYAESLDERGVAADEIRRRLQVLRSQFTEQPEGIEMIYDPLYGKPLTGELEKDGFKTAPNAFLVEAMKEIKPGGEALDVGAGMGRNALHLAKIGWDVMGIDLSAQGLAVMRSNAEKAGLKVQTVKTSYEDYDFGKERWDLVAMILSWAPVEDPAFLSRLKDSVRPGGHIVFEHVLQREENPFPPGVHAPAPGALSELFRDFDILIYREVEDYGDWGGPPTPHVRMVARKRRG